MKQIIRESFFNPKTIITGGIYFLILMLLFGWGITYTIYKDHEALKNRIRILTEERNKYIKEIENLKKPCLVEKIKNIAPLKTYLQGTITEHVIQIGFYIQMAFIWTNQGQFPAKNARPFSQLYYGSDRLVSTQQLFIKEFKEKYKDKLKELMKKERKWIFPGKQAISTIPGRMLTKSLWDDLINGHTILFGISAVVFEDEAGLHEAHMCTYADNIVGSEIINQDITQYNYKITWKECDEYNTQDDIKQ